MADLRDDFHRILKPRHAGEENILQRLGFASAECTLSIHSEGEWTRGGAETFVRVFALEAGGEIRQFIMKACTPFSPALPIDKVLTKWFSRRELFSGSGCVVPHVYGIDDGMWIEDFIPHRLDDVIEYLWAPQLRDDLATFTEVLQRHRFCAISPFSDLRCDGQRAVIIDFGEDLGDPNCVAAMPDYKTPLFDWLRRFRIDWDSFPAKSTKSTLDR
jgi:hypothetical protein